MKILHRPPRLYWLLRLLFPGYRFEKVVGFAFGNTIYSKLDPMPIDVIAHEVVHLAQMKHSRIYATLHAIRYLFSKKFRYETELEAFKVQLSYGNTKTNAEKIAHELAENKVYGNYVTYDEALKELCPEDFKD